MGRGRAKAKQTKVARSLKYRTVNTDLASLERELRGEPLYTEDSEDQLSDAYSELAAKYNAVDYDDEDEAIVR